MSFQTSSLVMTTMGVVGHVPTMPAHPTLLDGIHLRWAPQQSKGFPWYGYYLFRRINESVENQYGYLTTSTVDFGSTGGMFSDLSPGPHFINRLDTGLAHLYSDTNLNFTDLFPPPSLVEIDLENRTFLAARFKSKAREISIQIGFKAPGSVTLTLKTWGQPMKEVQIISPTGGAVVTKVLSHDLITGIELSSGPAVLKELGTVPHPDTVGYGWQFVPGAPQPFCLPVSNGAYPCYGAPGSPAVAETMALSRIEYGPASPWSGPNFSELHQLMNDMVAGGPGGPNMADVTAAVTEDGSPVSPPSDVLEMPDQRPLDFLLLGGTDPAFAQMTGLYFRDGSVAPNTEYDYLVIADHEGHVTNFIHPPLGGPPDLAGLFTELNNPSSLAFTTSDSWICWERSLIAAPGLPAPSDLRSYALPGLTVRDEDTGLIANANARNSAGFTWDLGTNRNGFLMPGKPIAYQLFRADYGSTQPTSVAPDASFAPLTPNPFLVTRIPEEDLEDSETSSQFPPQRLYAYDNYLQDGWYSYKLMARDLFGRYSPLSTASRWHQWKPKPDPAPHYYTNPPSHNQVHPFALELKDEMPPPPPTGVEASALDPLDPYLVKDSAYTTWRTALESEAWYTALTDEEKEDLVGLRVKWQWTQYHLRQAPNTHKFRIHYEPGTMVQMKGNVTAVSTVTNTATITLDNADVHALDKFAGAMVQVGPNSLLITGSSASTPTELTCKYADQPLQVGDEFMVRTNYMEESSWTYQLIDNDYTSNYSERVREMKTEAGDLLEGTALTIAGTNITFPVGTDLNLVRKGFEVIELSDAGNTEIILITDVDPTALQITLDAAPSVVTSPTAWKIGLYIRDYEVFLPTTTGTMSSGIPDFAPSLAETVVYGNVGVNAEDNRSPVNIGPISNPAKIFRVWRQQPARPAAIPPDSDNVYASRADYYGNSYYTYRWTPETNLYAQIYRALDESVYLADYAQRPSSLGDPDLTLDPLDDDRFPDVADEPAWDSTKRTTIATEINALNDACRDAADLAEALESYRELSNDALRILASMPQCDAAFQQLTYKALDPDDSEHANKLGPDNDDSFVIDSGLRAYIDTLPGKARNRYFYRCAYVDSAQNLGEKSLATVPVYLPKVTAPKTPKLSKVFAGDADPAADGNKKVTLEWATDRDVDTTGYTIYRASDKDKARDIRLMAVADTVTLATAPGDRDARQAWTDSDLTPFIDHYYRIVSEDQYGNKSRPSEVRRGRAFDDSRPDHPTWDSATPDGTTNDVTLSWTSTDSNLKCLVQRSATGADDWSSVSGWLATGTYTWDDTDREASTTYDYRLKVMDENGRMNKDYSTLNV